MISLLYGFLILPEPRAKCKSSAEKVEKKSLLADFFDKNHVLETFQVAFKKGANKRRKRVILLMVVVMVVIGPIYGKATVE